MGWVWTAVVVWILLAGSAAVLLGLVIDRADRHELEPPSQPPASVDPSHTSERSRPMC